MGTMPPKELLTLWTREDMTVEMAIGHILQNLTKLQTTVETNHFKLHQLQSTFERAIGKNTVTQEAAEGDREL